ncbi:DUF4198 domain-containing protein [Thermosulfuriphilus sp.]
MNVQRGVCLVLVVLGLYLLLAGRSEAHFQLLIPSDDIVTVDEPRNLELQMVFTHPVEGGPNMEMKRPEAFGVMIRGKRYDLQQSLKEIKIPSLPGRPSKVSAWQARYQLKRPGDHLFYLVPQPYFEPAEEKFIKQVTKVVVNAFGAEEGWDKKIGLVAEIVPLTRPYGLWAGNTFRGLVLINGKPAPNIEVEVEFLNNQGIKPPADPFITQVIKTDANGIFCYTIPWSGWWGFSALGEGGTLKYQGKEYPVELDAVIWIKAYSLPKEVK